MKLVTFASFAALCAVAELANALPFPSDYHGASAAAELQARTHAKASSSGSSGAPPIPPKSPLRPTSGNQAQPASQPAAPAQPQHQSSPPQPSGSSNEDAETQRKAAHDANTLSTAQAALEEAKTNNAATQAHNSKLRKVGYTGLAVSGLAAAAGIGFGVNSAIETYNRDHPAQQTAQQPSRRAIIDGEVYELYWVN